MEKDDKIKGNNNSYDFGARIYDPRIGRWLSLDPQIKLFPYETPFSFAINSPLQFIDPSGEIPMPVLELFKKWGYKVDSWFGRRNTGLKKASTFHQGLDINFKGGGNTDYGAPVVSTHDGIVLLVKNTKKGSGGRYIEVLSPDGEFKTRYLHLKSISVKKGDKIAEAQQIGELGGSAYGKEYGRTAHLHYEIWKKNDKGVFTAFDPTEGKSNTIDNIVDPQCWVECSSDASVDLPIKRKAGLVFNTAIYLAVKTVEVNNWVSSWFAKDDSTKITSKNANATTYTISNGLNIRGGPGMKFKSSPNPLKNGETVTATGSVKGNWVEVKRENEETGWIYSKSQNVKKD